MDGVSININLPNYGHFSPEELTDKVRRFAMELISQEKKQEAQSCHYTAKEVEQLLDKRMKNIEDGTAELVSHDEVKARVKALIS